MPVDPNSGFDDRLALAVAALFTALQAGTGGVIRWLLTRLERMEVKNEKLQEQRDEAFKLVERQADSHLQTISELRKQLESQRNGTPRGN